MGPLELLVIVFVGDRLPEAAGTTLRKVEVSGDVRIADALVVVKTPAGEISVEEAADVPALAEVAADYGIGDLNVPQIGVADAHEIAETLSGGVIALVLLVVHVWARETAEAVAELGGVVLRSVRIPEPQRAGRGHRLLGCRRDHPLLAGQRRAGVTTTAVP